MKVKTKLALRRHSTGYTDQVREDIACINSCKILGSQNGGY